MIRKVDMVEREDRELNIYMVNLNRIPSQLDYQIALVQQSIEKYRVTYSVEQGVNVRSFGCNLSPYNAKLAK